MRGDDVFHGQVFDLLGELVRGKARVDDDRLLGARARQHVTVDVAIKPDLDDPQLCHPVSIYRKWSAQR